MNSSSHESAQSENESTRKILFSFTITDIIKFLGALAVIIPLILGYLQYKQQVQENQNKSFREIVQNLSSEKKQDRLASASNLGTFLDGDNQYDEEAIDILINMVSIESDIDVLQAIRSSLEKVSFDQYKKIIHKLFKLERNSFIYKKYLEEKLKNEQMKSNAELRRYKELLSSQKNLNISYDVNKAKDKLITAQRIEKDNKHQKIKESFVLDETALELGVSKARYLASMDRQEQLELANNERPFRSELVANFIVSFLSVAQEKPLTGLKLYQNSWNYVLLSDLKLPEINISLSALTSAAFYSVDFNHSKVVNSTFGNSIFENTDFSHSTIRGSLFHNISSLKGTKFSSTSFTDVFFTLSDLKGADFTGAKGLKPVYFYKSRNLDQAKFDLDFTNRLKDEINDKISDADFFNYICDSNLDSIGKEELLLAVLETEKENNELITLFFNIAACETFATKIRNKQVF